MSTFNREEWETRGRINPYLTDLQKSEIDGVTHRVKSQLSYLAEMTGLNGPTYWPQDLMTVKDMRRLPSGAFPKDGEIPVESETLGDRTFILRDGLVYPKGNPSSPPYSLPVTMYVGYEYALEGYHEIEGSHYDPFLDETRLVPSEEEEGPIEISGIPFIVRVRADVVGRETKDYENFYGTHGGKGGSQSLHWLFDSLGLHGYSEESLTGGVFRFQVPEQYLVGYEFETIGSDFDYTIEDGWLEAKRQPISQNLEFLAVPQITGGEKVVLFTYWDIDFQGAEFTPRTEDCDEKLRVHGFTDIQSEYTLAVVDEAVLPPEDSSKSFIRFPPHIGRGSRRWLLGEAMARGYSPEYDENPVKKEVSTRSQIPGYYDSYDVSSTLYHEDYLVSDSLTSREFSFRWQDGEVLEESRFSKNYSVSDVTDYDPNLSRSKSGFFLKSKGGMSGNLQKDMDSGSVEVIRTPDYLNLRYPSVTKKPTSEINSRVRVCYAYCAADMSVVGDPVFDFRNSPI